MTFVSEKYIGCNLGSSLDELRAAAEDHGLTAWPMGGMTSDFLANCPNPVILLVKQSPTAPVATHFVLFVGWSEGRAKIIDPGYMCSGRWLCSLFSQA